MKTSKSLFVGLALFLLPLLPAVFMVDKPPPDPFKKTVGDFAGQDVLWIDARTRKEYEQKHIPHAVLLNGAEWEAGLARLFEVFDGTKPIVVYCGPGCTDSRSTAKRLRDELGQEVFFLKGGMQAWFAQQK